MQQKAEVSDYIVICESVPSIRYPQWVFVCARYNCAMMFWIGIPNIKGLLAELSLTYILRVWPKKKKKSCIYECRKFVRQQSLFDVCSTVICVWF